MKKFFIIIFLTGVLTGSAYSQNHQNEVEKKQFLCLLRFEKNMLDSTAWTPEKSTIIQNHFEYLQKLFTDGKLILAGRTRVAYDKTFGIVIFEAKDFNEAKSIAQNDPAVRGKIMSAEIYPYSVELMRRSTNQ